MNYINKYMKLIKNILKTKIIIKKNKQMTWLMGKMISIFNIFNIQINHAAIMKKKILMKMIFKCLWI